MTTGSHFITNTPLHTWYNRTNRTRQLNYTINKSKGAMYASGQERIR